MLAMVAVNGAFPAVSRYRYAEAATSDAYPAENLYRLGEEAVTSGAFPVEDRCRAVVASGAGKCLGRLRQCRRGAESSRSRSAFDALDSRAAATTDRVAW